ncbi:MAG: hypothetical protein QF577_09945 [Phycisphaerae bacterium]|jgi:hypothetical protein|nr:hypothetical protein [Phycisphaerae bacterium]
MSHLFFIEDDPAADQMADHEHQAWFEQQCDDFENDCTQLASYFSRAGKLFSEQNIEDGVCDLESIGYRLNVLLAAAKAFERAEC